MVTSRPVHELHALHLAVLGELELSTQVQHVPVPAGAASKVGHRKLDQAELEGNHSAKDATCPRQRARHAGPGSLPGTIVAARRSMAEIVGSGYKCP